MHADFWPMKSIGQSWVYRWLKWTNFKGLQHRCSISHHHKMVWYRNPKVGSRSISAALHDMDPACVEHPGPARLSTRVLREYYSFGFVRNPIARTESLWRQKVLQNPRHGARIWGLSNSEVQQLKDFDSFLLWLKNQDLEHGEGHYKGQTHLIPPYVNRVGKIERFDSAWDQVLCDIGLEGRSTLPRINATRSAGKGLSDRQVATIVDLYRDDYERFYPEFL